MKTFQPFLGAFFEFLTKISQKPPFLAFLLPKINLLQTSKNACFTAFQPFFSPF